MKASKLCTLLEKAIEKYGDIEVRAYSQDYARDIDEESEAYDFKLRVMSGDGALPGDSLEQETPKIGTSSFIVLFYKD